jgi:hypothetical protein
MAVPSLVQQYNGKYTKSMIDGRVFFGTNAVAGLALITTATTGGHPTLWNPSGSGVNLSIISLELSQIDGTNAVGSLGWYKTANAGSAIGTGAPVATFTNVAPTPALVGGTATSKALWSPTTNTFVAAPVFHLNIGLNLFPVTVSTALTGVIYRINYDGELGIAPSTALSICSIAATTTSKFICKVVWEEIPV